MKEYKPRYTGTVTKYVFIESPDLTPSDLAIRGYEISGGVMIKETCFGLQITGTTDEVNKVVDELRKLDPTHIFVKDRGFPPGDRRRCRANLGGARPGFFGHESEIGLVRYITHGLETLPERAEGTVAHPPCPSPEQRLDLYKLKKIIEKEES
jgi:putative methanogenesis marker protein 6